MNHNIFPKIAIISDLTGFGRCALAEQIPLISHFGIQCCSVPTAILSNHSAYDSFFVKDFTKDLGPYFGEWGKLGLKFDGVLTGFYDSPEQIDTVMNFIRDFSKEDAKVIVDPIMGGHGKVYQSIGAGVCEKMRELVAVADLITPNWTELCLLMEETYEEHPSRERLRRLCAALKQQMKENSKIVVTGIQRGLWIENYIYEDEEHSSIVKKRVAGETRCGTGDIFSAILAAGMLRSEDVNQSVKKAADFIAQCIAESDKVGIPKTDGVCFELLLRKLK